MMRRVHLSDEDLQITEQACRSLAARYRRDAERQKNPLVRDSMLASAERFERLGGTHGALQVSSGGHFRPPASVPVLLFVADSGDQTTKTRGPTP